MAALTQADVSVSVVKPRKFDVERPEDFIAAFTFGDGAKTYPTGGVPLPDYGDFGMSGIEFAEIQQPAGDANYYRYDAAAHKLEAVVAATGVELADDQTPAATTVKVKFTGYPA